MRAIRDCFKSNLTQLSDPCKKALHRRLQDDLAEKNGTTPTQPPATDAPATSTPTQQGTARRVLAANDVPTADTVSSPLSVAADSMDRFVPALGCRGQHGPATNDVAAPASGPSVVLIAAAAAGAVVFIAGVAAGVALSKRRASADGTVAVVN
jgi:hypothetical protein